MKLKTILALLIIGLIVLFSIQNSQVTDVEFLFWKLSISRVLLILGCFGIGVLVGILISMKNKLFSSNK